MELGYTFTSDFHIGIDTSEKDDMTGYLKHQGTCTDEPIESIAELIAKLAEMPPDAAPKYVWDGSARSNVNYVWLSKAGDVILSGPGESVDGDDCPEDYDRYETPEEEEEQAWWEESPNSETE